MNEIKENRTYVHLLKHWWCCLHRHWVVCFERVELADCLDSVVGSVFSLANDRCFRRLWCCFHWRPNRLSCYLLNFDSNCWATTVNWMPISGKMVRPVLECHPMNQVLAFPDTNDMVAVFVRQLQRLLVDNTNRLPMVELRMDLDRRQLHTAMHQYKADHHTIFGMRHSYLQGRKIVNLFFFLKFALIPINFKNGNFI